MTRIYRLFIYLQDTLRGLLYCLFFRVGIQRRARRMTLQLLSFIPYGSSVLDIGTGTGDMARELARKKGAQCLYLDRRMLFFHAPPRPLILCDAQALALRKNTFDTVLLITMLHHCKDPKKVLLEAKRVCRERILVIEDIFSSRWELTFTIFKDIILNLELFGHPRQFHSTGEWEKTFSDLGLAVEVKKEFHLRVLCVRCRNAMYILRKN